LQEKKFSRGHDVTQALKWIEQVLRLVDKSHNATSVESTAYFSPGDYCRNAIISLLNAAKKRIDICVSTISDNRLSESILLAHQRNINVRILTDNDKANDHGSDVYTLKEQGIPVCMDSSSNHMHHKFALVDQRLVNGSFNWTRSATDYNQENIVVSADAGLVHSFDKAFDDLWTRFSK
jgi:mitochondrial cardiolipin hydrolase